jgi:hypothetical protein
MKKENKKLVRHAVTYVSSTSIWNGSTCATSGSVQYLRRSPLQLQVRLRNWSVEGCLALGAWYDHPRPLRSHRRHISNIDTEYVQRQTHIQRHHENFIIFEMVDSEDESQPEWLKHLPYIKVNINLPRSSFFLHA